MKKILFYLCFCILFSGSVYSDTNGVWHFAEDIRGGIFGQNEFGVVNYSFINPVYFKTNTYTTNLYNSQNAFFSGKIGIRRGTARVELDVNGSIYADNLRVKNTTNTSYLNVKYTTNTSTLIADNIDVRLTNTDELYVNGSKVVTQGELLDKITEITNEGGSATGSTTLYLCPKLSPEIYSVRVRDGRNWIWVDRYCSNQCDGQISASAYCLNQDSTGTSCVNRMMPCTNIGQVVPDKSYIKLSSPSGIFASFSNAGGSGNRLYSYTFPTSFVNKVKLNKLEGVLTINSGWTGGSGFDCRNKKLYFIARNSGKVLTSGVLTQSCLGTTSNIISVDFEGNLITNPNLEIQFYYLGGDDDEWVHFSGSSFSFRIIGDNGGVTILNPN